MDAFTRETEKSVESVERAQERLREKRQNTLDELNEIDRQLAWTDDFLRGAKEVLKTLKGEDQ